MASSSSTFDDRSLELQTFKYVLIEFPEDNFALAIVSSCWIFFCKETSIYKCYWPGSVNANQFAKKSIDPLPSWKIWNCNIKRFFKTFEEGNTALSNYTSDESHIKPNKRLIVPNKRLLSSDDEQVFKKIKNTNAFSMPDMPTYESFDNEENLHLNLDSIALKDCSNNQDNSIIVISQVNTENTHPPVFQSDNKVIDIGGSQNNEYHQIFHFFKEISEQYQSIQRTLDVIKIDIQDLQRQIEYQGVNKRSSESSLVEENLILPFSTLDELNDYESKLTDNNIYEKAMKRTLLKVGSSKLNSKTTYNVLRKVMTNEIAETFNVTGKGLKLSFNNYKMSKLIQDVVYVLQNITETEYKTYLGQWLRQASNRKNEKKNLIV